jgi:hypothetical protein
VQICTSIDGPEHLHDKQRKLVASSAFKAAVHWIKRINKAYGERGLDTSLYHVEALLTTTREALSRGREIVDTYAELGCKALFLRPIDPFGFMERTGPEARVPPRGVHAVLPRHDGLHHREEPPGRADPGALRGDLPHEDPHGRPTRTSSTSAAPAARG